MVLLVVQHQVMWTLEVSVDDSTIEINSDEVRLKDGGTTLVKQADMAVIEYKVEARWWRYRCLEELIETKLEQLLM